MSDVIELPQLDLLNKFITRLDIELEREYAANQLIKRLKQCDHNVTEQLALVHTSQVRRSSELERLRSVLRISDRRIADLWHDIRQYIAMIYDEPEKHPILNNHTTSIEQFVADIINTISSRNLKGRDFELVFYGTSEDILNQKIVERQHEIERLKLERSNFACEYAANVGRAKKKIKQPRNRTRPSKLIAPPIVGQIPKSIVVSKKKKTRTSPGRTTTGAQLLGRYCRADLNVFCNEITQILDRYIEPDVDISDLLTHSPLDEYFLRNELNPAIYPLPREVSFELGQAFIKFANKMDLGASGALSNAELMFMALIKNMINADRETLRLAYNNTRPIGSFDQVIGKRWWKGPFSMYKWVEFVLTAGVIQEIIRTKIVASDEKNLGQESRRLSLT